MEEQMRHIAELIAQIYDARNAKYFKTRILKVRKEIEDLALRYSKIVFTFDSV